MKREIIEQIYKVKDFKQFLNKNYLDNEKEKDKFLKKNFFYVKDNDDVTSFCPASFFKTKKDIRKEKLS